MDKAFLYTGTVFLIMVGVLLSANFLFLSKHGKGQAQIADMQMDLANNIANDMKRIAVWDKNNIMADAMSDAAYGAVMSKNNLNAMCSDLKTQLGQNDIQAKIKDYITATFSEITSLQPSVTFGNLQVNTLTVTQTATCVLNIYANFSYIIKIDSSFSLLLNRTLIGNKTLTLQNPSGNTYNIFVDDGVTGARDFSTSVYK
jgi:hypothetical protein